MLEHTTNRMEQLFQTLPEFVREHSCQTALYVEQLARTVLELSAKGLLADMLLPAMDEVGLLGRYHDLGKTKVDDTILESSRPLCDTEIGLIRSHTIAGALIICDKLPSPEPALKLSHIIAQCCLYHHERWDGKGYPFGLSGRQIPFAARLVSIADAFDTMTANRPYHKGIARNKARQVIWQESGKQFDPMLAQAFCDFFPQDI